MVAYSYVFFNLQCKQCFLCILYILFLLFYTYLRLFKSINTIPGMQEQYFKLFMQRYLHITKAGWHCCPKTIVRVPHTMCHTAQPVCCCAETGRIFPQSGGYMLRQIIKWWEKHLIHMFWKTEPFTLLLRYCKLFRFYDPYLYTNIGLYCFLCSNLYTSISFTIANHQKNRWDWYLIFLRKSCMI